MVTKISEETNSFVKWNELKEFLSLLRFFIGDFGSQIDIFSMAILDLTLWHRVW